MNNKSGSSVWYIPDGFIPERSAGILESHEAICLLNVNNEEADVKVTVYFEELDPIEDIQLSIEGRRTKHVRTDYLKGGNGQTIPRGVPYALSVESSIPVIVQFSRMDATQAENTLMTTMAYPAI